MIDAPYIARGTLLPAGGIFILLLYIIYIFRCHRFGKFQWRAWDGGKVEDKRETERERGCPKALNLHRLQWDPLTFYGCLHVELSYFWANLLFCFENVVACHMFIRAIFCLNSPVSVVSLFENKEREHVPQR